MIPLSVFDAPRVLAGARVPLTSTVRMGECSPSMRARLDAIRLEWSVDRAIEVDGDHIHEIETRDLGLDPTDPGTAQLIDRRVAEALGWQPTAAVLREDSGFEMACLDQDGSSGIMFLSRDSRCTAALAGLDCTSANLPEARARLLCALYPPA